MKGSKRKNNSKGILKLLKDAIVMVSGGRNSTGLSTGTWKNNTKGICRCIEKFFILIMYAYFFLNFKLSERRKVLTLTSSPTSDFFYLGNSTHHLNHLIGGAS